MTGRIKRAPHLIPDRVVREMFGGIAPSTLYRWERNPGMNFPRAIVINGRKYRDEKELNEFIFRNKEAES